MSKKRKKNNRLIWILLGVLLLLIIGALAFGGGRDKGIEVDISEVEKRTITERVAASGKVFPEKEVKISSDVSGEIVELYVEEGDSVQTGQRLVRIDPEAYTSAVERGQASLDNTKAQLASSRSSVKNAEAQKAQIEAQVENARRIYQRNKQLHADGVIALQELETSESNLQGLEANLRSAEANVESGREGVRAAEYTVKSMEAQLRELRTNLNRTSILAPTTGIVSSLSVEEGERVVGTIQMAGTEMMRISNFSSMEVRVEVTENDILNVSLDDEVEIDLDAYANKSFHGVVSEIANSAANVATSSMSLTTEQVTNFVVKVRIDPDTYQDLVQPGKIFPLRPGMSASVEILTEKEEDVLSLPIECVTAREKDESDEGKEELIEVVFRMEGDTVAMVPVETGIQDDYHIQITDGVEEGDEVVSGPYNVILKDLEGGKKVREKD